MNNNNLSSHTCMPLKAFEFYQLTQVCKFCSSYCCLRRKSIMLQQLQNLLMLIIVVGCSYVVTTNGQECSSFDCGNGVNFSYPFWQYTSMTPSGQTYCGYPDFSVHCYSGNSYLNGMGGPPGSGYSARGINYTEHTLTVVNSDYLGETCPRATKATGLLSNLGSSNQNKQLIYYSNCSSYPPPTVPDVSCLGSTPANRTYVFEEGTVSDFDWIRNCKHHFRFPVLSTAPNISKNASNYGSILQLGFKLEWSTPPNCTDCEKTGHRCGYDEYLRSFICLCSNGWAATCSDTNGTKSEDGSRGTNSADGINSTNSTKDIPGSNMTKTAKDLHDNNGTKRTKVIYGVFTGVGALVLLITLLVYWRSICSRCHLICEWSYKTRKIRNLEAFIENDGCLTLHRHSYSSLKKITNCFKDKIGQGGYGDVFKGKLISDEQFVAVKVLTESKGNGEDFINEVATIGRTNHVNIVSLIGYCSEGLKRALVYEYMPNGSLEKYIYTEKSTSAPHLLGWEKLYEIALGIANGLEYLHRGCNTRILHFDIKPHNILLDKDFVPKISDFGLAKLCPTRDSVVSMLGTRGTIGYIAPEVYCRNFGGVSPKSDVYSYGMMVLEMVGGRKNIDATVENISEIYFPQWVYNRLEQHESIGFGGFKELFEEESIKKMIIVGLWCIQSHPSNRPSMSMVIEMLQKNVEDLQMPPNPFQDPTTTSTTS